ncbi:hypothetical protein B0H14DRAFT_2405084 [Mycena olivaceomarginata]|nr:hypothetical protein B0H14DRAFT_2405084 [Mycena olivaceomarginata]
MSSSKTRQKRRAETEYDSFTLADVLGETSAFTTQSLSADRRRTHTTTREVELPSPVKKKARIVASRPNLFADVGDGFEYVFDDLAAPPSPIRQNSGAGVKPRAKRYLSSDWPLREWTPLQDEYLAEFVRLNGRGDVCLTHCPTCLPSAPRETPHYRCVDCDIPDLFCKSCIVRAHASHPLDRIELWDGTRFRRVSLKTLGLHVQLGHSYGQTCKTPIPAHKNFMVIHTNGMHKVGVDFCGCVDEEIVGSRRQQLLRRSWFPATAKEPKTCSTFRVLDMFHTMTLQGKVTTYDFYSGLEKLTDNSGLRKMKDRYKGFMRTMREWRHLAMLKRGGRGNDGDRLVAETRPGELAVVCPACPQPGVNLPADWESASGEERFLYILYIAIDACFRLKRQLVSSELKDPGLGSGWSYFTEDGPFRTFLLSVTDQKEMSTCSGLAALDYANTKFSRGYRATGVGLGVCARHEFVQRNGAADLQKGERYANMDYILGSLLRHHYWRLRKYLSYDICCQWSKYLIERMKEMPNGIKLNLILSLLRFVIPKLHIYGHKLACQLNFSLNYTPGAGRTDGEGIERPWANIGPVATSTREMGPGSHQDTLNDHWGHWNWQKLVGLGELLRKRLLRAIPERNFQRDSLATFTENQGEHVEEWVAMVLAFEADGTNPNPYELPKSGANEHDVRLECVEEEAAEQERGVLPINNVSPSAFIIAGLDLEEQQRRIKVAVAIAQKSESSKNSADVVESRTKLARYVARFRKLQAVYMPGALQALADRPVVAGEEGGMLAENVPLFLPSALSAELRASGCNKGVDRIEQRFRDAQCRSALDGIHNYFHIKSRFRTYKGGQVRHQGATTRARGLMDRNDEKMRIAGEKYIAAWEAKRALVGEANVDWHRLDPKKDLRCMDEEEDRGKRGKGEVANEENVRDGVQEGQRRKDPTGEGRRTMSWIWMGVDTSSAGTHVALAPFFSSKYLILNAGLRVEWCKAWARTRRWTEEVQLLKEEMRRTPLALRHKAQWWLERRAPTGFVGRHAEGAAAYATSQAALYNDLADSFKKLWAPLMGLEDVDDAVLLRLNKRIAGTDSDNEEEEDELDPEEADEEDGNDGVDGEEGGEEEQNGEEEEEGSTGGESGGEDDD